MRTQHTAPKGHWLLGHLPEQRRDPLGLLTRGLEQHGDVVPYRFGPYRAVQLNHPREVYRVLAERASAYHKWGALKRARPLLGSGLVLSEGELWRRQRRMYQRAFRKGTVQAMIDTMADSVEGLIRHWESHASQTTDVLDDAMRLALSIVSRTLISRDIGGFGAQDDADAVALGKAFDEAVHEVGARTLDLNPLAPYLPTQRNRSFARTMALIDRLIGQVISARRAQPVDSIDLLGELMALRDEESGETISDELLRDELLNILLAGRGTSALGLCWMWWLLDQHPEIERAVRAEVLSVLGPTARPTAETLDQLTLTARVFQESLRLYPPIWTIARQATEDDELGGLRIKAGTIVLISPFVIHRHPELWPDPERFDPDRFLPHAVETRDRLAWMPFGAGPRVCVGGGFALQEARIITAMVSRRFRLRSLPQAAPPEPEPLITLKPKGGLKMLIEPVPS